MNEVWRGLLRSVVLLVYTCAGLQMRSAVGRHQKLDVLCAGADTFAGRASGGLAVSVVSIELLCRSCLMSQILLYMSRAYIGARAVQDT